MSTTSSPEVHSVTTARKSLAQDQDERARRYFLLMGVRTACFLVALGLALVFPGWWALLFFFAAAVLPYVAVVLANAVNVHEGSEVELVDGAALTSAPATLMLTDGIPEHPDLADPTEPDDAADVHVGEVLRVVEHRDEPTDEQAGSTAR